MCLRAAEDNIVPGGGRIVRDFLPLLFRRPVQLSLYFFIPIFLILFSLAPAYLAVFLLSRSVLPGSAAGVSGGMAGFQAALSHILWLFLISGGVALAAGLLIAFALARPVYRLRSALREVGTGGLKGELLLDGTGEFEYLGKEFNGMVSRLAVQERLRRLEELAALGTLAAGVAHEVRNPLGSVRGLAQLMMETAGSNDQKQYARRIIQEVDRLNTVVERLLHLARPASGSTEPLDVNRLAREAVEFSGYERTAKGIRILEEYDESLPPVPADARAMGQALLNLLINAVQAIPESGTVTIRTGPGCRDRDTVRIEVCNTQSRIAPGDYRRIFDPFYTTKENGTGLGLSITHQVVSAHGGTIEVESSEKETAFSIELPLTRPPAATPMKTEAARN